MCKTTWTRRANTMRNRGSWMKGTLSVQHDGVWSGKYGYGHRSGVFDIPRITKFGVRHDIWFAIGDMANGKGLLAGLGFRLRRDINALSWAIHAHGTCLSSDRGCKYTHLKANLCTLQISPTPSYATPDHLGRSLPLHSIEAVAEVTKARYNVADDIISTDIRRGGR